MFLYLSLSYAQAYLVSLFSPRGYLAPKVFSLFVSGVMVLVHTTRWNLSQGGVLFYGDLNSYDEVKWAANFGAKRRPVAGRLGP